MKTKLINSQLNNYKTYQMYFRQMLSLAENVFEFENLPEFIDLAFLNKSLVRNGSIAFFKDEELGVLALPYTSIGTLDVYSRPKTIQVQGQNGYQKTLKQKDFVIMYDNNGRYPIFLDISQLAERIALCVRTEDVNVKQQRTPRIFKTTKDKELSLKSALDEIDSFCDTITTYETMDIDGTDAVLAAAPYVTDKIDLHLKELWAEFFRLIGVANLQEQKKERVIRDEMYASQGGTIASRFSRFEPRKRAIEQINAKFGIDIKVRYYDGEPDMNDNVNKDEENKDVSVDDVSGDS